MIRTLTGICFWLGLGASAFSQPYSATQSAGPVNETGATLNGMVTPNGQSTLAWFEWGTDVTYGRLTSALDAGQGFRVVRVSAPVTGLTVGTVYHGRLVSSNALGVAYGGDQRWITGGKLVSWGSVLPRVWLDRLTTVTVNGFYTVGVKTDGTVVGWGEPGSPQPSSPMGISNIMAAACGSVHSLALKANGTVVSWGKDGPQTRVPYGLSNVVAVACTGYDSLALKADGTLVVWGQNASSGTRVPVGLTNVVAIASANSMFIALKANGTVAVWGSDCYGASMVPASVSNVVAVAGGFGHCLALKANGQVVAWGLNSLGQTDVPAGLSNVIAIACGDMHNLALKSDGTIATWGLNAAGEGNIPPGLGDPGAASGGPHHSVAVRALVPADFKLFATTQPAWNVTTTNATLNGMALPGGAPAVAWFEWGPDAHYGRATAWIDVGSGLDVVRVSAAIGGLTPATTYHYRLVASNAVGVAYGMDTLMATGLKVASWGLISSTPIATSNTVAVAAGDSHCLALKPDGTVVAWGTSYGGPAVLSTPPGLSNVVEMAASGYFNLILKANGTVTAWGTNRSFTVPITVPSGLSNVVAVAAGMDHCLVLKTDGTVCSWGFTSYSPTNVPPGLNNVVAIQAAWDHSLALRADGTVVGWGGSAYNPSNTPQALNQVVAIAARDFADMALLADGVVVVWNANNGQRIDYPLPSSGPSKVAAMAAGGMSWLFLQADGAVALGGSNTVSSAIVPAGLAKAAAIAAGFNHYAALAPNTPPQPNPRATSVSMNGDHMITAPCFDPNGDPLTYRIGSLPERGQLYQFDGSGRGEPILAPNTAITDSAGRVVYAPVPGEFGLGYASFTMVANDGEYDSAPGVATLNAIPVPQWQSNGSGRASDGKFQLSFAGYTNVNHGVWASTNLVDWIRLGWTSESSPGQFLYLDTDAVNYPLRFYQLRLP